MAKSEGKILGFNKPDKIRTDWLETFPYRGAKQLITYTTKEFSAVCPFSGLPDIATVMIEYIPNRKCLELKSLKYYFVSFRSVGIYQEA
ncbi:MAG: NADPH-dependent 7-cyano-7-deazaguanine reductase QueF, partial [Planctomycetes bacterium]|nr:NADPH-dependent 7-cyano-7-deazaguanine reductase QueF [Planctomycetota bacterium]